MRQTKTLHPVFTVPTFRSDLYRWTRMFGGICVGAKRKEMWNQGRTGNVRGGYQICLCIGGRRCGLCRSASPIGQTQRAAWKPMGLPELLQQSPPRQLCQLQHEESRLLLQSRQCRAKGNA